MTMSKLHPFATQPNRASTSVIPPVTRARDDDLFTLSFELLYTLA